MILNATCHGRCLYTFSEFNVIPMITFELLISEEYCSTEQKLYGRKSYFWCSFNHVKRKANGMIQLHNLQIYSVSWAMYSYVLDNGVRHDNRHGQIPTELVFRMWNQWIANTRHWSIDFFHNTSFMFCTWKKSKEKFARLIKVS